MSASKLEIEATQNGDGSTELSIKFANGEQRSFTLSREHPLYDNFAAHGVAKKLRDQIGSLKDTAAAVGAVDKLLAAFERGEWNAERNATGEGAPQVGVLAQALSRLYGTSHEKSQEYVAKLDKKQQADLRATPKVAAVIADIKAEQEARRAAKAKAAGKDVGAGAESLLDEFERLTASSEEEAAA